MDFKKVEGEILEFIRRTVNEADAKGAVIGLSGGIDSSVTANLCVRALGNRNVLGVIMPTGFTPTEDVADARDLAKTLGIETKCIEIDPIVNAFLESIPVKANHIVQGNLRARTRMSILYFLANHLKYLVAGTGDKSESLIGYFTKYGDGGVDFLPVGHLYKTEVRELGAYLGLPPRITKKPSSPQLWKGQKATDEIPADYDVLDPLLKGLFDEQLEPEKLAAKLNLSTALIDEVRRRNAASEHKRRVPKMIGA